VGRSIGSNRRDARGNNWLDLRRLRHSRLYIQSRSASASDLFGYTFDPTDRLSQVNPAAWISRVEKKKRELLVDWLGSGCRDSDYSSGFNITRLRQNDAVRFANK